MLDLRLNNNQIGNRVNFNFENSDIIGNYKEDLRRMTRVSEAATVIDFRQQLDFQFNEIDSDELDDVIENMYEITASLEGEEVGFMNFTVTYGKDDPSLNDLLIKLVEIDEEMQGLGIGQLLYKEFGEVYTREFSNIPVSRFFVNPVAEYAFRKAISLGWVSDTALDENRIKRNYSTDEERSLWTDLRQKLPEQYRGA